MCQCFRWQTLGVSGNSRPVGLVKEMKKRGFGPVSKTLYMSVGQAAAGMWAEPLNVVNSWGLWRLVLLPSWRSDWSASTVLSPDWSCSLLLGSWCVTGVVNVHPVGSLCVEFENWDPYSSHPLQQPLGGSDRGTLWRMVIFGVRLYPWLDYMRAFLSSRLSHWMLGLPIYRCYFVTISPQTDRCWMLWVRIPLQSNYVLLPSNDQTSIDHWCYWRDHF